MCVNWNELQLRRGNRGVATATRSAVAPRNKYNIFHWSGNEVICTLYVYKDKVMLTLKTTLLILPHQSGITRCQYFARLEYPATLRVW